ncbi:MAG: hypothetical protein MUO82_06345, partial [Candidatus Thermoplasmatota archaeon]|nr:hypothetical protein [Candidatus Thermoplasmatota archaeon]
TEIVDSVYTNNVRGPDSPTLCIDRNDMIHIVWQDDPGILYKFREPCGHIEFGYGFTDYANQWDKKPQAKLTLHDITFTKNYMLSCGNIDGEGKDEVIILGPIEYGYHNYITITIISYTYTGLYKGYLSHEHFKIDIGSIYVNPKYDALACGDIDGDGYGKDEIILATANQQYLLILYWTQDQKLELMDGYPKHMDYNQGYGFAVGRFFSDHNHDDIVIGNIGNINPNKIELVGADGVVFDTIENVNFYWGDRLYTGHQLIHVCEACSSLDSVIIATYDWAANHYFLKYLPIGHDEAMMFDIDINQETSNKDNEFAFGDIDGDGLDEILAAINNTHREWFNTHLTDIIYNGGPWEITLPYIFEFDISNDKFAYGELNCNEPYPVGDAHTGEFLVARGETHNLDVYYYWGVRKESYTSYFKTGDFLYCGDLDNDGEDEIIHARSKEEVTIFSNVYTPIPDTFKVIGFPIDYPFIGCTCGNVYGDQIEEILLMEEDTSFRFYNFYEDALWEHYTKNYQTEYKQGLTCGNIDGDDWDEILVGYDFSDMVDVWDLELIPDESLLIDDTLRVLLDDLIDYGGFWSDKLCEGWNSTGYLLIVGETEIIPAFSKHYPKAVTLESVRVTDLPYRDTTGDLHEPELRAGRIIGDHASDLIKP